MFSVQYTGTLLPVVFSFRLFIPEAKMSPRYATSCFSLLKPLSEKNIDSYNSLMACFEVTLFWTDWCFVTAVADQEDDEVCGGHSPQPDRCPFDLVDWQVLEHPPSVCGPPMWYHSLSSRGDVTGRQLWGLLHSVITVSSGCR